MTDFLDIIHHPTSISENGICLCPQVKPAHLGPVNRTSPYFWRQVLPVSDKFQSETGNTHSNNLYRYDFRTVIQDKRLQLSLLATLA